MKRTGMARRPKATDEVWDYSNLRPTSCAMEYRHHGCAGALEPHHVIPVQRIRRMVQPVNTNRVRAIRDLRNIVVLCSLHHRNLEAGVYVVDEADLHPEFWDYVAEFGLTGALPRHLLEQAA